MGTIGALICTISQSMLQTASGMHTESTEGCWNRLAQSLDILSSHFHELHRFVAFPMVERTLLFIYPLVFSLIRSL